MSPATGKGESRFSWIPSVISNGIPDATLHPRPISFFPQTCASGTSLSGSGQVRLRHDTVFGPGDMSDFTGEFCHAGNETWRKMGCLTLSARNGEEQQFSIVDGSNLSVVNGGEGLVSVLLDDTSAFAERHLFGRLALFF